MIELTDDQLQALEEQEQPPRVRNPRTQETFVLIRQDVYETVRQIIGTANDRNDWDDPAFDVYDQDQAFLVIPRE